MHLHVVGDGDAIEAADIAEEVGRDLSAETGWEVGRIDLRVASVPDHDGLGLTAELCEGDEVLALQFLERDVDDRGAIMWIGSSHPDAGEVLEARSHSSALLSGHEGSGQLDDALRVASEA